MIFLLFLIFCLGLIADQRVTPDDYNGRVDVRKYALYSNLLVSFPKGLIRLLFWNTRRVRLPVPLVLAQAANYGFFAYYLIRRYIFHAAIAFVRPFVCVWAIALLVLVLLMNVDFEIYVRRHPRWPKS